METATATAERIAAALIAGFDRHYALLRATSTAAKERFEAADWAGAQRAVRERIRFYDERVAEAVELLRREHADELDEATWQQAKALYIGLLVDHKRPELAETFFNSVTTRVLGRTYLTNDLLFVRATISTESIESDPPNYRSYYPATDGLRAALRRTLEDFRWGLAFADLDRDVEHLVRAFREHVGGEWPAAAPNLQLQVLGSAFYRNKAAYVVGKVVNGDEETPFAVPVLHDDDNRLELDTILLGEEPISILFSLSRAYFMVDMDVPSGYVAFLQTLMPAKPRSELYTAVGLGKQGKTLFFRDLLHHLHHSRDLFVEAPGTRGQVMHVFNLPSYPYVFKVIKDRFGPTKRTDRATVMQKFELVKDVDRVGRMVDATEFVNLALPRARFSPELVEQLLELAPSSIELDGEHLVVRHCYVERRMTPLNVHLAAATPRAGSRRGPRLRQRDPGARDREHLPGRHAVPELRAHALRPGRLLRLRRDRGPHRLRLPDAARAAEPGGRVRARALVRGRSARRLPRGVGRVPARRPGRPRRVPPRPRRPPRSGVLAGRPAARVRRRDRRLLPVSGVRPLPESLRLAGVSSLWSRA